VKVGVIGCKVHSLFAFIHGCVPLIESQANAAGEIVCKGLVDAGGRQRAKQRERLVGFAGLERTVGLGEGIVCFRRGGLRRSGERVDRRCK
jgi:hypothetical protein